MHAVWARSRSPEKVVVNVGWLAYSVARSRAGKGLEWRSRNDVVDVLDMVVTLRGVVVEAWRMTRAWARVT